MTIRLSFVLYKGITRKAEEYSLDFIDIFQIENGKITNWREEPHPDWRGIVKGVCEKYQKLNLKKAANKSRFHNICY
jgi:hypothetical protein